MHTLSRRHLLAWLVAPAWPCVAAAGDIVIVAHPSLPALDAVALQRLYTGRLVEIGGRPVQAVNLPAGHPARQRFLTQVLHQDEDRYRAYWTVRRHVGKGTPPPELSDGADVLRFVQVTPGAVGYVSATDFSPGAYTVVKP